MHQLDNFIAVAKHKHFTKAAQQQSVSQPALSRSIIKLEQELGVQLFVREGRTVRLTPYGEMFLHHAIQAQTFLQKGVEEIQEKISIECGEISVAFLHTLGPHLIPKLIAKFKKMNPNVTFQLYQGANDYLLHQVEQGVVDMCLSSPPAISKKFETTKLKTESLYLVVPIQHHLANNASVSFHQLKEEEFICFKKGYGLRSIFDQICSDFDFQPKITFEGEEATTVAGFVTEGMGIAVLPKISDIENEYLRFINISDYSCERVISLSTRADSYMSPVAKKFKSFVIEFFQTVDT
jgi:LysR family transcriptional regulator, transcription activator of glutamate synthase operon